MADFISSSDSGQRLFKREAAVTIYNRRTSQSLTVQGLRMKFNIEKSSSSDPNQSTLEIYNLNEDSRNFANIPPLLAPKDADKQLVQKGQIGKPDKVNLPPDALFIELMAGYQGLLRLVCTGNASGGSSYQKPDWVTKFQISDGGLRLRQVTFEKSYSKGFPIQRVILDVLESFGLPMGYVMPSITTDRVEYGLALSGPNKKILDDFALTYGFKWSVQNNAVNLFSDTQRLPDSVILSPKSGLISSPINTDKGIEFDCLLIPTIAPGVAVRLTENRTFVGEVIVQRTQISGDTHGSDWRMHVEARLP